VLVKVITRITVNGIGASETIQPGAWMVKNPRQIVALPGLPHKLKAEDLLGRSDDLRPEDILEALSVRHLNQGMLAGIHHLLGFSPGFTITFKLKKNIR